MALPLHLEAGGLIVCQGTTPLAVDLVLLAVSHALAALVLDGHTRDNRVRAASVPAALHSSVGVGGGGGAGLELAEASETPCVVKREYY